MERRGLLPCIFSRFLSLPRTKKLTRPTPLEVPR